MRRLMPPRAAVVITVACAVCAADALPAPLTGTGPCLPAAMLPHGRLQAKKKSLKEAAEIERLAREMYLEEAAKTLSPEELWAKKVEDDKKAAAAAAAAASGTGEAEADKTTATAVAVPKKDAVEVTLIEAMNPKNATDFEIMARAIAKKASKYERSPHYMGSFLKTLAAEICESKPPPPLTHPLVQ